MIGILGYGSYVTCPDGARPPDEDAFTLAVEAARAAVSCAGQVEARRIAAVYVGTLAPAAPAQQPRATLLGEVLGVSPRSHCADVQSGGKAGTEAFFALCNLVKPSAVEIGLAAAADAPEQPAADAGARMAGAAAFLIGRKQGEMLATIDAEHGYRTATPAVPQGHAEQHIGVPVLGDTPALVAVQRVAREIMARRRLSPADFAHVIMQQTDRQFPPRAALSLGFSEPQLAAGWTGAPLDRSSPALPLLGLCAVLDVAKPGERILLCSYGAGVGADGFVLTVTPRIEALPERRAGTQQAIAAQRARLGRAAGAIHGEGA